MDIFDKWFIRPQLNRHVRRQACLLAALLLFLLGLTFLQASPAAAAVSVPKLAGVAPAANALVPDSFLVTLTVNSSVPVKEVTASAGGLAAVSLTKQTAACGSSCEYRGMLDISSLPWGAFSLQLSAVDVDGTASAPFSLALKHNNPPKLQPASPLPFDVADPNLAVSLLCSDDDPDGCSAVKMSINGTLLAQGTASIDQTIAADKWLGQQATVQLNATDASGLTLNQSFPIYVEASDKLTVFAHEQGLVLDSDANRTLIWNAYDHRLRIHHRDTDAWETLPLLVPEKTDLNVHLTPDGAMGGALDASSQGLPDGYYQRGLDPYGTYVNFEWQNGALEPLDAADIRVNGRYAVYRAPGSGLRELFITDTLTGSEQFVGFTDSYDYALDEDGTVVYANGGQLFRYANGAAEQVTQDGSYAYSAPVMDGDTLLYARTNRSTNASELVLRRTGGETVLPGATVVPGDYMTAGGWTAYTVMTAEGQKQLWLRSPEGEDERLTPTSTSGSRLIAVSPAGDATFTYDGSIYLSRSDAAGRQPAERIVSDKATMFWRDGWQAYLGTVWYEVTGTAVDPGTGSGEDPDPGQNPDPGDNPDPGQNPDPGDNPDPGQNPDPGEHPDPGGNPDPGPSADIDGNGVINMKDAIAFLRAFGTKQGELHYDPKADYDGDGAIDIQDAFGFAKLFMISLKP